MAIAATYVNATTFTVSGTQTATLMEGRRVKANCSGDGFKYGTITSSSAGGGLTTVVLTGPSDDLTSNLASIEFGIIGKTTNQSLPVHTHDGGEGTGGQVDHADLASIGSNAHSVIDTHLSSTSNPHTVTAAQVGNGTAQWNADKSQGADLPIAGAGDDGYYLQYQHATTEYTLVSGVAGGGNGVSDHGALTGLGDDDHPHYSLADGTRDFSGIVAYDATKTFTLDEQIVDKKYVDDEITTATGSLTTDHGSLTGLADDDHTQYYNDTRLDAELATFSGTIDHDTIANTHNLTTDIDHNTITNNHNLTTDIDHDLLTNFASAEHFTWESVSGTIDHDTIVNFDQAEHFTEASIDHGSISGLTDDDHVMYSRVDGTRPFTGEVGGVYPTASGNLATKQYVDDNIGTTDSVISSLTAYDATSVSGGKCVYYDADNHRWKSGLLGINIPQGLFDGSNNIVLFGHCTGLTGLVSGTVYYVDDDGDLTTEFDASPNSIKIGYAVTNTEMLVDIDKTTPIENRAVFGGGELSSGNASEAIDYIAMRSQAASVDFGDLTDARRDPGSTDNGIGGRGVWAGGWTDAAYSNIIDYVTILAPANALDLGDLTIARRGMSEGVCSNKSGQRGVFGGGTTGAGVNDVIDYITVNSLGNATSFGTLTAAKNNIAATSNGINQRGLFMGGYTTGYTNVIEYITIDSVGNGTDLADLVAAKRMAGGLSNSVGNRALIGGGLRAPGIQDTIEYKTITTADNAVSFGSLTVERRSPATASNGANNLGLFAMGLRNAGVTVSIDAVQINVLSNAADWGDMTVARLYAGGVANAD